MSIASRESRLSRFDRSTDNDSMTPNRKFAESFKPIFRVNICTPLPLPKACDTLSVCVPAHHHDVFVAHGHVFGASACGGGGGCCWRWLGGGCVEDSPCVTMRAGAVSSIDHGLSPNQLSSLRGQSKNPSTFYFAPYRNGRLSQRHRRCPFARLSELFNAELRRGQLCLRQMH